MPQNGQVSAVVAFLVRSKPESQGANPLTALTEGILNSSSMMCPLVLGRLIHPFCQVQDLIRVRPPGQPNQAKKYIHVV